MLKDITLVNLNLMFGTVNGKIDFQAYFPIGITQIASSLEKAGFTVDFRDYQLFVKKDMGMAFDLDRFCHFLKGSSRVVGLSCMSNLLPFALLAAKRLKELFPDKIIILGGVGPTGVPGEIMENFGWVDFVCSGEGELGTTLLMESLRRNGWDKEQVGDIPGYFYRKSGRVVSREPRRIEDLDRLPFPAYHLVKTKEYDAAFSLVTTRGCPYRCTFCTETNHWKNKVTYRGIDSVIEEMRLIRKFSAKKVVLFQDDQITLDRARAVELFTRIKKARLGLYWKGFVRANLVDEELLKLMAESGCIQVRFGIESGSNSVLKKIRKGFTIEEATRKVLLASKYIPSVHASFIWGYPLEIESLEDCVETTKWIYYYCRKNVTSLPFLLSPLPNSEIFRKYKGPLDFNAKLQANFNISGAEDLNMRGVRIFDRTRYIFDFIRKYPRIFPGFFLYDYKNNIRPKQKIVYADSKLVFRQNRQIKIGDYSEVDL